MMLALGSGCNTDETMLTRQPRTSCCAAWVLTGHRLVLVQALGYGDPNLINLSPQLWQASTKFPCFTDEKTDSEKVNSLL